MLLITVTRHNDEALPEPITGRFTQDGGTIGRAPDSTLLLPDPDRKISRTHAVVECRGGQYFLRDKGTSSPVLANGKPVGNGRELRIDAGDQLTIGGYRMYVDREASGDETTMVLGSPATDLTVDSGTLSKGATLSWSEEPKAGDGIRSTVITTRGGEGAANALPGAVSWADAQSPSSRGGGSQPPGAGAASPSSGVPNATGAASAHHAAAYQRESPATLPLASGRTAAAYSAADASQPPPQELLAAFLRGAGVPDLDVPGGLTPERMRELGAVLRVTTDGLLTLLAARANTKRDVKADATMISVNDNNPLKFAPAPEAALAHLLTPRGQGFMPPLRAVDDAFDSLRSHQQGFMAGMQAALSAVLARFDPHLLEEKNPQRSFADSLLPGSHKARLWDLFSERFDEIAREADADFHELFKAEFLRAYQARVGQWRAGRDPQPGS